MVESASEQGAQWQDRRLLRLRGVYALVAGGLLLFVVPLYQVAILSPTGYTAALDPASAYGNFGPLLAWTSANQMASRLYRIVQFVPFLIATTLPGAVGRLAWTAPTQRAVVAIWLGRVGFALFALAIVIGLFTSAIGVANYEAAASPAQQVVAADAYAGAYAVETLLSRVLGGACVAAFLWLASAAMGRLRQAPTVFRLFGFLVAIIEMVNALLFALAPAQVETPTATVAFFGLALWLIALGIVLLRATVAPPPETDPTSV